MKPYPFLCISFFLNLNTRGVGITGGVLLMKSGSIVQPEKNVFSQVYTPSNRETFYLWIGLILFSIVFVVLLILMFR